MKRKRRRTKPIRVVERKLQQLAPRGPGWSVKIYGMVTIEERLIEIDPRQSAKSWLNTFTHELLHFAFPRASESRITQSANFIARNLWRQNVRRVAQ